MNNWTFISHVLVIWIEIITSSSFCICSWNWLVDCHWLTVVCCCELTSSCFPLRCLLLLRWYEILQCLSLELLDVKSMSVDVLHLLECFTFGWDVILYVVYFLRINGLSQVFREFIICNLRVFGRYYSNFMWSIFLECRTTNVINAKNIGMITSLFSSSYVRCMHSRSFNFLAIINHYIDLRTTFNTLLDFTINFIPRRWIPWSSTLLTNLIIVLFLVPIHIIK